MHIRIYQINAERDQNRIAFLSFDNLQKFQGNQEIKSGIYDKVFEGEVACENLEQVYKMFNLNHPRGFKGHSLSVSDVVEIAEGGREKPGFYFCDSFGFKQVPFAANDCQLAKGFTASEPAEKISVLLVQPKKYPKMVEIEDTLEAMQAVVGGDIEEYMPFEDEVALICNEEGKITGLPLNRAIYTEEGETEMTYSEMKNLFREKEKEYGEHLTGYIVFTEDSFTKPYPLDARTYVLSSDNKAFRPNMGGYSIYASSLDGSDKCVRLEQYMAAEQGGKDGWKIERCYIKADSREMVDIIAGDFFIAYAPYESDKFQSLPKALSDKYMEKFRYPERFSRAENGIKAEPFKPIKNDLER